MSKHTNVYLDDSLTPVIESLVRESASTSDVPALSQSQVIRLLLKDSARRLADGELDVEAAEIDGEDLAALIPDHRRAKFLREELKEETWLDDMRGGFEGRVRDQLSTRFANGYDPDAAADFAETYIKEAQIYWQIIDEDDDMYQEKVSFVRDRIEQYREKYESTTYDPNAEWLSGFDGVEEGEARDDLPSLTEAAAELLATPLSDGQIRLPQRAARDLAEDRDVPQDVAADAVDRAIARDEASDNILAKVREVVSDD